ncbi:MAG: hypothetical protein C5B43_04185 [Verrucomicrobia bacterium]|nr:MAG: hypothetical protein C5B43_04185 [Verrucomicrobiota bacterium]
MSKAIIMAMHLYTPFGKEFYQLILDFQLRNLEKYKDEFDRLYLIDSNWDIIDVPEWVTVLKVNPHLRYYDAYKEVLPQIKEDLVLFMDNDMIIYRENIISHTFDLLSSYYDVVSIIDTIGTMKVPLKLGNKFCPYFFAAKKELLMKYLDVDWSPDAMPYTETFGLLTEAMLKDGLKAYEMEDDKTDNVEKNLGYYHIRAGSTPAWLLATKHYGNIDTYWEYLKNQPHSELLRQCYWYTRMGGDPTEIEEDSKNA